MWKKRCELNKQDEQRNNIVVGNKQDNRKKKMPRSLRKKSIRSCNNRENAVSMTYDTQWDWDLNRTLITTSTHNSTAHTGLTTWEEKDTKIRMAKDTLTNIQ